MAEDRNENRNFMHSDYSDDKLSKSKELNQSMSIAETNTDQYENAIHRIGRGE